MSRRELSFTLHPVPPFRLDLTAWALQRRANNEIDRWDGHTYERAIVVELWFAARRLIPLAHP